MTIARRDDRYSELFPKEPRYRLQQIDTWLFSRQAKSWNDATSLPAQMRATLAENVPWQSWIGSEVHTSKNGDTHKALLKLADDKTIETVLMENGRGQWSICVSSQVGCAMRCSFCATGKMGFIRNLTRDEIVDQYRFWIEYLAARPEIDGRISNIVFMGMGEPLANYVEVKNAINTLLKHTDLGPTHITVSSVGHLPRLEDLLNDPEWPDVRLAISMHSADAATRKKIVPTSFDDFLEKLSDWAIRYLAKFGNRRHHITFEYVMLGGVNDSHMHAEKLAALARTVGNVKVNLIPYNFTGMEFSRSTDEQIEAFKRSLEDRGIITTRRRTMGDDIAAACGQLATEKSGRSPVA